MIEKEKKFLGRHVVAVNPIVSEDFADLLVPIKSLQDFGTGYYSTNINHNYAILNIPVSEITPCSLGTYCYCEFPGCYTLQSYSVFEETGITRVQINPNFDLYGEGVLIGIVDTGIDYLHDAFINEDDTTRIVSIWDQTLDGFGTPPTGITYGTEFTREMINDALKSQTPLDVVPTFDGNGHGTMIAGIVAGRPNQESGFSGVVPRSELVVVKLKEAKRITKEVFSIREAALCYQETDIMMGVRYLETVATELNRPLVICIALGTNQGGHDGHTPLSRYLNQFQSRVGRFVTVAAGNEGNSKRHYSGTINVESQYTEFEFVVGKEDKNFFIEIWHINPERLGIELTSPSGERVNRINPGNNECVRKGFVFETTQLTVNNILAEQITGNQLILLRFANTLEGIWKIRLYNIDATYVQFNAWMPSGDIISNNTYFIMSDPSTTITDPGNTEDVLTITAYQLSNGGIWEEAGRGFTRFNYAKPDLAAPGVNIPCPVVGNRYSVMTGTGAASAVVTGIVAMVLEWSIVKRRTRNLNGKEIKAYLLRGARRTPGMEYPNDIWGYGKVDIYEMFQKLSDI
ncbi:MAG: peptidase S8 [Lachnospiraceae bacterium]|nr:peptidase S8 [Lachnospiraceae bacterium]